MSHLVAVGMATFVVALNPIGNGSHGSVVQVDRSLPQGHRHWHLSAMALKEYCSGRHVGSPLDKSA
ncbi:hypothetical protein AWB68_00166 [Caballeronia choica]|uniref:Uncharacterized protein n=1 Tax=Caballeronia choica TaxID=326476 RepID=A0A158EZZ1_9BURK|nr:hypothetical protein [Caballeronia choica]SAL13166.1 hypothetical protein AWB68_00166 [Caballeronia choica]